MPVIEPETRFIVLLDDRDSVIAKYETTASNINVIDHDEVVFPDSRDEFDGYDDPPKSFPP